MSLCDEWGFNMTERILRMNPHLSLNNKGKRKIV